ncbi:hypothetical protein AB0E10_41285 [Streptomyces sp. NPDC048045]|uniref:hypothetical protein n=1 Tax=Streptomyces sp. NPDC048045 TaxID=3154710 RepID=UPI00343D1CD0
MPVEGAAGVHRCRTPRRHPRPDGAFGSADLLRIHIGAYRVMYEISGQQIRVNVIHP